MSLKQTPLYDLHRKLGAKLVPFSGWEMPLSYSSILEEHRAVREHVGLFDVSHMGQISLRGSGALAFLQHLVPNDAAKLEVDQALYTQLCNERGGTLDDLVVYRLPEQYLLVVNAGTAGKDFRWVAGQSSAFSDVEVTDLSARYAQVAIQGPQAEASLQAHLDVDLSRVAFFEAVETEYHKEPVLISRSGYTGEDGFEIYGADDTIIGCWKALIKDGVTPIGLGARDSLRFEACLPLYGHELNEETTPIEAGLGWSVPGKSTDYLGKAVLERQKREGPPKRLVGFKMVEAGVPREGYPLFSDGEPCGTVTSGMKSPTLGDFLGMGFVNRPAPLKVGTALEVEIHGKRRRAEVVKRPFYRRSS